MAEPTPSLAAEADALMEAYAALNRNDILPFVRLFDPQIERIEPSESPGGGTYHGLEAVKAHLSQARQTWAEGSCQPQRFIVAGNRIILFVDVRVRLKHESAWREVRIADVFIFRNGKVIEMRTFVDSREALQWAGVNDASPPAKF